MRFGRLVLLRPADLELDVLDSLEHAHRKTSLLDKERALSFVPVAVAMT